MITSKTALRASAAAALTITLAAGIIKLTGDGPSTDEASSLDAASHGYGCINVEAPMLDIPAVSDQESRLRIPKPADWTTTPGLGFGLFRFALSDTSPARAGNEPSVVITVQPAIGTDARAVLDESRPDTVNMLGGHQPEVTETTVCGQPAEIITFTPVGDNTDRTRPATTLSTVAISGGHTWVISATVQNADPATAANDADVQTILRGLEVTPASADVHTQGR